MSTRVPQVCTWSSLSSVEHASLMMPCFFNDIIKIMHSQVSQHPWCHLTSNTGHSQTRPHTYLHLSSSSDRHLLNWIFFKESGGRALEITHDIRELWSDTKSSADGSGTFILSLFLMIITSNVWPLMYVGICTSCYRSKDVFTK